MQGRRDFREDGVYARGLLLSDRRLSARPGSSPTRETPGRRWETPVEAGGCGAAVRIPAGGPGRPPGQEGQDQDHGGGRPSRRAITWSWPRSSKATSRATSTRSRSRVAKVEGPEDGRTFRVFDKSPTCTCPQRWQDLDDDVPPLRRLAEGNLRAHHRLPRPGHGRAIRPARRSPVRLPNSPRQEWHK